MSLRLRLTLMYMGLLGSAVLLLSIVIYSMVSVVMIDQVDDHLQMMADHIIDHLEVDRMGDLVISHGDLNLSSQIYVQIWSVGRQLVLYSENARDLDSALDPEGTLDAQPSFGETTIDQTSYRVLNIPLVVRGEDYGWLQVAVTLTDMHATQRLLMFVFGFAALFAIGVAGTVGWLVTGQALEPLKTMSQITDQITSTDDLSQRIPVKPGQNNEISELALTFNQTLVRLERLFNAQRRFLADVSHELRTPLTVIKGNVGLMRMMKSYDEESLKSVESEVDRLTRLVGNLLLIAQAETGRLPLMLAPVEIDDLLFEVFEQLKILSGGQQDIRIENIEPAIVTGDRDRLKQVFLNLGSNAIKYTPEGGQILLSLYVHDNWVQIIVSDEGVGIPTEELNRLFERFYRGDKSRSRSTKDGGFGLGLSIAYWIVRNHGGRIDVETELDKGTTFSVWLPLSQAEIPTKPIDRVNVE